MNYSRRKRISFKRRNIRKKQRFKRVDFLILILLALLLVLGSMVLDTQYEVEPLKNGNSVSLNDIWIRSYNTPPTPKYQTLGMSGYDLYYLLSQYSWNVDEAYTIIRCESGGNVNAKNWGDRHRSCVGSFGLFQMACLYGTQEELLTPEINIERAFNLYQRNGGWRKDWVLCSRLI